MQGGYIRQERPYVTFAALFVSEKREKKKSFFMFLRGRTMFDPCLGDADHYKIKLNIPKQTKLRLRGAEVLSLYFLICFSALSSLRLHRLPSAFPAP